MKRWIIKSLVAVFLTLLSIAGFNFYMDPLWTFDHKHLFGDYQRAAKERQQKSHALYFRAKKYDTLMLGSSRTARINQHTFSDMTYNYAVSDMTPIEYIHYIRFAITQAKQPIKTIYIGLDFFGALDYKSKIAYEADSLLKTITQDFYRYKLLLSLDALDYSIKNIKYSLNQRMNRYTYNNVERTPPLNYSISKENFEKNVAVEVHEFEERYSKKYDENYKNIMKSLVQSFPKIKFIVFTTPVSILQFKKLIEMNQYQNYERWLRESVDIFQKVHHFMYINPITQEENVYFQDSHHTYMATSKCLAQEILTQKSACPKVDMTLTKDKIYTQLRQLQEINLH